MRVMSPGRGALILAATVSAWVATPARAQTPEVTLPSSCTDQVVAPARVILTCGDAGLIAESLVWTGWGADAATATGTASVNLCEPSCAEGERKEFPVALTASERRDCDYGRPQYTLVTYSFPAASPFPPDSPGTHTVRFPCPKRPHADPRIRRMRMSLTGHGPPGDDYFVRVHVRLRVCAVRGRSEVVVNESLRVGGQTFGEHTRTIGFRQRSRCQAHRLRWRLRDEFFGVGTYKVAATVWDRDSQPSKTVTRKQTTLD
jgi:hypothetical protein